VDWSIGVLEYWSGGILEYWNIGIMRLKKKNKNGKVLFHDPVFHYSCPPSRAYAPSGEAGGPSFHHSI
jgi:hypothetical protein